MLAGYERTLHWAMDHRPTMMLFSLAILIGTFILGAIVPKGFIPSEDQGQVSVTTDAPEGTSFESMVRHQQEMADIVKADPAVDGFMSSLGAGGRLTDDQPGAHVHPPQAAQGSHDERG